jgi:hypothetical protein
MMSTNFMSRVVQDDDDDNDTFLLDVFKGDVAAWTSVNKAITSILLCDDSLGVWL